MKGKTPSNIEISYVSTYLMYISRKLKIKFMNTEWQMTAMIFAFTYHRVPRKGFTLNISTIWEILIFRYRIATRIMPYAYFSPPRSHPIAYSKLFS